MHFRTSAVIVMVDLRLQYLMKQYMSHVHVCAWLPRKDTGQRQL